MIGSRLDAFETNLDKEAGSGSGSGGNSSGSDYSAGEGGNAAGGGGERERTTASRCRLAFYGPVGERLLTHGNSPSLVVIGVLSPINARSPSNSCLSYILQPCF